MKMRFVTFLLSCLLLPVFLGGASAQTAAEVVEKALAAAGGREALGKLTSRRATGTVTLSTPGGDISGSVVISLKSPNKSRVQMTLDLSAVGGGQMTVDQRFDGTSGFSFNSEQGETEITGNQLENMRNNLFPSPLLNYAETGLKLEVLPKEKVGGKDAVVLLATPKTGSALRMLIDAETYLVARLVVTVNLPQLGGNIEQTTELSDFRTVDGVKVPFRVVNTNQVQTLTIKLDKVEHNVAMDDAMFVKK